MPPAAARRPAAVLFDLDGTLVDSIDLILQSARHAFRGWSGPAPTDAEWLSGVGIPLATAFRRHVDTEDDVELLIARYREYQMAHHDRLVRCYDSAVETVAELRRRGHPIGIVTSKSDTLAQRGLEHVGLAPYVDTVVGCDACSRHKPHPEPVLLALERLKYAPSEAFFVGDSIHDMLAGRAAGVRTVAALWGPFSQQELSAASPTHYADSIKALLRILTADQTPDRKTDD